MRLLTRTALLALLTLGAANLAYAQSGGGGSGGSGSGGSGSSSGDGAGGNDTRDRPEGTSRPGPSSPGVIPQGTSPGSVINPQGSAQGAMQSGRLSESDVRSMLQQRGYTQVGDIETSGGAYSARAMRNGQSVNVRVDPQTGTITER